MSFNITLQKMNSEKYAVSKETSDIKTVSGVLKDTTSIIDPVIMIEIDLADVVDCNYLSIPKFGRKYFVNNIRSVRNGLVEFTCHVDVLSSWASELKTNSAIVRRNEKKWNLYLNDGTFKIYQNPNVLTKAFPSGFTTQEFVLAVAG